MSDLKKNMNDFLDGKEHLGQEFLNNQSKVKLERLAQKYAIYYSPYFAPSCVYLIMSFFFFVLGDELDWSPLTEPFLYLTFPIGYFVGKKFSSTLKKYYDEKTGEKTKMLTEDQYVDGAKMTDSLSFNRTMQEFVDRIALRYPSVGNIREFFKIPTQKLWPEDVRYEENPTPEMLIPKFSLSTGLAVVGVPGQGKTVLISRIASQVCTERDKSFIVDVKGDFVKMFYNPVSDVIFCPSDLRTCRINIVDLFDNYVNVGVIADIIVGEIEKNAGGNSDHFAKSAKIFLEAIFIYAKKHSLNNKEIFALITSRAELERIKDEDEEVATLIQNYFEGTSGDELKSVLTTLMTKSRVFQFLFFADNLSNNAVLDLQSWVLNKKGGRLFFLATEELNTVYAPLFGAILGKIFSILLDDDDSKNQKFYFFLNELPQLGQALGKYLQKGLAVGRSKGLNIVADMQSPEQLKSVWGNDEANVFFDTCNSVISFKANYSAEFFEKFFGKTKLIRNSESFQFGQSEMRDGFGISRQTVTEPLLRDSDFSYLQEFEFFARISGNNSVLKTKLAEKFIVEQDGVEKYIENPLVNINVLPVRYKEHIMNIETIYYSSKLARENDREFITID